MSSSNPTIDPKAVAAHVLRHLAREQARGRLVRLDDLASAIGVRRGDVRRVVASLHTEGHVDAERMKLTMSGLALAAAMRNFELRQPRVAKRGRQSRAA
jgi:DNA-binding IclR family transcriptional regulator